MKMLMTLTEAAKILGVCRNTARKILAPIAVSFPQTSRKFYRLSDISVLIDRNKKITDNISEIFSDFVPVYLHRKAKQ